MTDVIYAANAQTGGNAVWAAIFQWLNPTLTNVNTELRVTNSDGSITTFFGTGFAIDPATGIPTAGVVTSIRHSTAAGAAASVLEEYFLASPFPSLLGFYTNGLSPWFLTGDDQLTGTTGAETLQGGDGNDSLSNGGGPGVDTLIGGKGDDYYSVHVAGSKIVELAGEGIDWVELNVNVAYTLPTNVENFISSGISDVKVTGNSLNNKLLGSHGADQIYGLAGDDLLVQGFIGDGSGDGKVDKLIGGLGNDTYFVGDTGDLVIEGSNQGLDTVVALAATYTLSANVENIESDAFLSTKANFTGNALNNSIKGSSFVGDVLTGLAGNDILDGLGSGGDTFIGGTGNDTFIVLDNTDTVVELAGGGTDTIKSAAAVFQMTKTANVENFFYTGGSAPIVFGNDLNNTIDVTATTQGSNLFGGKGNDTYILGAGSNAIDESVGEGTDTIISWTASASLQKNVENGTLKGNLAGTTASLLGNELANVLIGDLSDDNIDGGYNLNNSFLEDGFADTLKGGKGNDYYIVRDAGAVKDIVVELANEGIDTVEVQPGNLSYTLAANVENLVLYTLTGVGTWTGNTLNNYIEGSLMGADTLKGLAGDDTLWGKTGQDTLLGGTGNDTYIIKGGFDETDVIIESAGQGSDTVETDITYSIANLKNVENVKGSGSMNITLTGSDGANILTGNTGTNTLIGGKGNDTLSGGVDFNADALQGGLGDDTYIVDEAFDLNLITELDGEGTDTIVTKLGDVTLPAAAGTTFVENLTYVGSSAFKGTGNALNNIIAVAGGLALADTLDGGAGDDTLKGGKGDDIYILDSTGDKIVESSKDGTDTIKTSLATYVMGANATNVENLTYTGASSFSGTGNALANVITGGAQNDVLKGFAGNDTLDGGMGDDEMVGGLGNDTFIVDSMNDVVTEFKAGGIDTIKTTLQNFDLSDPAKPGVLQVENLTFTGATTATLTGNAFGNIIVGGMNGNTIHGKGGNDIIYGGSDPDLLYGDEGNDQIYGNGGGDSLFGGIGNDLLDSGGDGAILEGGDGSDTYVVRDWFDQIANEASTAAGGVDTVEVWFNDPTQWVMADNVENLSFKGPAGSLNVKGNASVNKITGGSGDDVIDGAGGNDTLSGGDGNDTLDGGIGNDAMAGGKGDDSYFVDAVGDKVSEAVNQGFDSVRTTLLTYTLGANVEKLELNGLGESTGIGNALSNTIIGTAFSDTLKGLAGDDTLDGGANNDKMEGGLGNDTYIVDSFLDVVTELAGQGTDTVKTTTDFSLSSALNVENITYIGGGATFASQGNALANVMTGGASAANTLTGNEGNDVLIGGDLTDALYGGLGADTLKGGKGADVIEGGSGNDTITGGLGADIYYFDPGEVGVVNRDLGADVIWDFEASKYGGSDVIRLSNSTVADFADLLSNHVTQAADGVVITIDNPNAHLVLTLKGLAIGDLQAADFDFI